MLVVALLALLCMNVLSSQVASGPPVHFNMEFVRIPAGEFMMGCSTPECAAYEGERPAHKVRISHDFEMSKYEVTQWQWKSLRHGNPSSFKAAKEGDIEDNRPVEMVTWNDASNFASDLNNAKDPYHYRLPTEAEWEYAARAGSSDAVPANIQAVAWIDQNAGQKTHPVGQKAPNAWGLYDMYGNVFEWVQDFYDDKYYEKSPAADPTGPMKSEHHVLRGGSWLYGAGYSRASLRFFNIPSLRYPDLGFRVLREKIEKK